MTSNLSNLHVDAARHATDCVCSPLDLWDAVRLAISGSSDGTLRGGAAFDAQYPRDIGVPEFYDQFVDELNDAVEIRLGHDTYRIAYGSQVDHRWGEGGAAVTITQLLRGKTSVLVSRRQLSYITYSDDSEDHAAGRSDEVFLLDENDELAALVFAILTRTQPLPPR